MFIQKNYISRNFSLLMAFLLYLTWISFSVKQWCHGKQWQSNGYGMLKKYLVMAKIIDEFIDKTVIEWMGRKSEAKPPRIQNRPKKERLFGTENKRW